MTNFIPYFVCDLPIWETKLEFEGIAQKGGFNASNLHKFDVIKKYQCYFVKKQEEE